MNRVILVTSALLAISGAARAADDLSPIAIEGYIGGVSDLRDRGISLSDRDPAVVASLGLFHDNGFYAGLSAATIDDQQGGDAKAEFYAGYRMDKGDYIYDFSLELDSQHGNGSRYYPEIKASMARDFGLAFIRGGLSYAPDGRWNTPDNDSLYVYSDLEIPVPKMPELTLIGRVGYDMRSDRTDLWDWSLGVSAFLDTIELNLSYEDSSIDHRLGNGAFVLGARLYF